MKRLVLCSAAAALFLFAAHDAVQARGPAPKVSAPHGGAPRAKAPPVSRGSFHGKSVSGSKGSVPRVNTPHVSHGSVHGKSSAVQHRASTPKFSPSHGTVDHGARSVGNAGTAHQRQGSAAQHSGKKIISPPHSQSGAVAKGHAKQHGQAAAAGHWSPQAAEKNADHGIVAGPKFKGGAAGQLRPKPDGAAANLMHGKNGPPKHLSGQPKGNNAPAHAGHTHRGPAELAPFKPSFDGGGARSGIHHDVAKRVCNAEHIANVNHSFNHWHAFHPAYYHNYPGAWYSAAVASAIWHNARWNSLYPWCGWAREPVYYYWGDNVCYRDDAVYYGENRVASAAEYYDQAEQIADAGQSPPSGEEEWTPLGVFGLVKEGETNPDKVIQLAVNKAGQLRGNYYDTTADTMLPLVGSVDKQTQRAAWKLENNGSLLMEAGIYSLTKDKVPVLLHYGEDRTENRTLVRLKQPDQEQPQNR